MKKADKNNDLQKGVSNQKEISLEELDILVRKCHHLHDEEILESFYRMFQKVRGVISKKHLVYKPENKLSHLSH